MIGCYLRWLGHRPILQGLEMKEPGCVGFFLLLSGGGVFFFCQCVTIVSQGLLLMCHSAPEQHSGHLRSGSWRSGHVVHCGGRPARTQTVSSNLLSAPRPLLLAPFVKHLHNTHPFTGFLSHSSLLLPFSPLPFATISVCFPALTRGELALSAACHCSMSIL